MLNLKKMIQSAYACLGWPYVSPGTNDANGIDCSGLFVRMYRDQNADIYHGSNTIYRKYCIEDKGPINNVSQLKTGMAVFKWNSNTPERFNDNLGDFQHIGFVVGINPLKIIHASSAAGCVTIDDKLGKWKYYGKLKDVNYDISVDDSIDLSPEPIPVVEYATVYSENRKPVKMRAKPSTDCGLYDELPFGTIVEVVKRGDSWSKVNYHLRQGWYIMTKFLLMDESSIPGLGGNEEATDNLYSVVIEHLSKDEAEEIRKRYPKAVITCG